MKKSEKKKLFVSIAQHLCLAGAFICAVVIILFLDDYGPEGIRADRYENTDNFLYNYEDYLQMTAEHIRYANLYETDGELDLDKEIAVTVHAGGEKQVLHYRLGDLAVWMNRGAETSDMPISVDSSTGMPADYESLKGRVENEGHAQDSQAEKVLEQVAKDAENRAWGSSIGYGLASDYWVHVTGEESGPVATEYTEEITEEDGAGQEGTDGGTGLASPQAPTIVTQTVTSLIQEYAPLEYASLEDAAQEWQLTASELEAMYQEVLEQISYYTEGIYLYQYNKTALQADNTNFRYYIIGQDGSVCTNMEDAAGVEDAGRILEQEGCPYIEADAGLRTYQVSGADFGGDASAYVMVSNWSSYADSDMDYEWVCGVDLSMSAKDVFYEDSSGYSAGRTAAIAAIAGGILCIIGYVACFILLTMQAGHTDGSEGIALKLIDRWKTELEIVFFGLLAGGLLLADYVILSSFFSIDESYVVFGTAAVCAAIIVSDTALMCGWLSLVRRLKAGNLYSDSLLRSIVNSVQDCRTTWKMWVIYLIFLLANLFFVILGYRMPLWILAAAAADIGIGFYLGGEMTKRGRIVEGISRITEGDMDYQIPMQGLTGDNLRLAQAVNHIREGLSNAVEKSLKSERLKTDLITNVSHDIKTPLTSIINYIDLIKRENIPDEKIRNYLKVLEAKSQRLKNLTEDLVEASKASSGNMTLDFVNIDFVELVNQTNGEFQEKFTARRLEIVANLPDPPVYVKADGRRLWRVIENLYSNVAKYAMEGTRVYVDLTADELEVVFTVKNISEQPLNIRADELTERFVRGDVSRSTEGSGLGLSIAKSLTELQNGTFEIYLDGDLFRVTVKFPCVQGSRKKEAAEKSS